LTHPLPGWILLRMAPHRAQRETRWYRTV